MEVAEVSKAAPVLTWNKTGLSPGAPSACVVAARDGRSSEACLSCRGDPPPGGRLPGLCRPPLPAHVTKPARLRPLPSPPAGVDFTLTITRLTEPRYGAVWLRAVNLTSAGASASFREPEPTPGQRSGRRMLFIGDSYT